MAEEETAQVRLQLAQGHQAGKVEVVGALFADDTQLVSSLRPCRHDGTRAIEAYPPVPSPSCQPPKGRACARGNGSCPHGGSDSRCCAMLLSRAASVWQGPGASVRGLPTPWRFSLGWLRGKLLRRWP
jgi:hypothetical protein